MCECCEGTATWLPNLACPPAPVLWAQPLTLWTKLTVAVAWMTLVNTEVTDYYLSNAFFLHEVYNNKAFWHTKRWRWRHRQPWSWWERWRHGKGESRHRSRSSRGAVCSRLTWAAGSWFYKMVRIVMRIMGFPHFHRQVEQMRGAHLIPVPAFHRYWSVECQ